MNLNNIQKAVLTIGVLAAVFLLVDWVADKDWLVPGPVPGANGRPHLRRLGEGIVEQTN